MSELSENVVSISINYLGPAAQKFLQRQTNSHMNGLNFDAIERKDLPMLAKWVSISAGLIIEPEKAKELAGKIEKL